MIRKILVALIWKNPLSPYGSIRWWLFALVILLTMYAPVELTRVILTSVIAADQIEVLQNVVTFKVFEIAFTWVIYLAAMFLAWRLIKKGE